MKGLWLVLQLSVLLVLVTGGSLGMRLWSEWQRGQAWLEHSEARVEREERVQKAMRWWRVHADRYRALRRQDERVGTNRRSLWQLLEPRALEREWEELTLKAVPAPPRESALAHWRRQRYRLTAELPHDGDARWLWRTLSERYGARIDWRRCRLERMRKDIVRGASHLSWQCEIDLWRWHTGEAMV